MDVRQLHDHQQILDNACDFIFWKDKASNYLGCNNRFFYATRAKNMKAIVGKNDEDLLGTRFSELYRQGDKRAIVGERIQEIEPFVIHNRVILNNTRKQALYEGGEIIGVVAYSTALTNAEITPNASINNKLLSEHFFGITEREGHVLFFLIRGLSAKRIAALLSLSPRTIEQYCTNIKNKFCCLSKDALVRKAYGMGFDKVKPESLSSSLVRDAFCLTDINNSI